MQDGLIPKILFEDNRIIAVEKPQGILSQSDFTNRQDILSLTKNYIKLRDKKPGNVFLGLVHRLDKEVGGVIIFAKNTKTAAQLSKLIRERNITKTYLAVVNNFSLPLASTLKDNLVKNLKTNFVEIAQEENINSKPAILNYKVIEKVKNYTLVIIHLVTGRSHQIRVQFSSRGCPLYGDKKYGGMQGKDNYLALWSASIEFMHPVSKKILLIKSPPPDVYPWSLFNYRQ